ncbi:diguanylate cyclase [Colwelliaceae bacterium 6471]
MKALTFNQLQLRIFALIFLLFTSAVVGYRVFIERPQLEATIAQFAQRELVTLSYAAKKIFRALAAINYDYSVWDATYDFIEGKAPAYIKENFPANTFISLEIDGVFIFNQKFELMYAKGYDYKKNKPLNFEFYKPEQFSKIKSLSQLKDNNQKIGALTGVIATKYGPAIMSATEIRRSDKSGDDHGLLIFVRLFDKSIVSELSDYTLTAIKIEDVTPLNNTLAINNWLDAPKKNTVTPSTQLYIRDINGAPLSILTINHANSSVPPILDKQSFIFILLLTLLIFVVYTFISHIIVRPVKKLAYQIKTMDENNNFIALDENSHIDELINVSKHFNALMFTVQRQNELLSQQVYVDMLTNITNRRGFEQHLEQYCQLFIRQKLSFTVILADVDHFKQYNDSLGHIAGDNALIQVAHTLNAHFKRTNDMCARYGGEEFIMLYGDIDKDNLADKLDEILQSFATLNLPHPNSETAPYVTVSLGACVVSYNEKNNKNLTPKAIIRAADDALYQAKNNGRNQAITIDFFHSTKR